MIQINQPKTMRTGDDPSEALKVNFPGITDKQIQEVVDKSEKDLDRGKLKED